MGGREGGESKRERGGGGRAVGKERGRKGEGGEREGGRERGEREMDFLFLLFPLVSRLKTRPRLSSQTKPHPLMLSSLLLPWMKPHQCLATR